MHPTGDFSRGPWEPTRWREKPSIPGGVRHVGHVFAAHTSPPTLESTSSNTSSGHVPHGAFVDPISNADDAVSVLLARSDASIQENSRCFNRLLKYCGNIDETILLRTHH
jgi:hypothetical protein